MFTRVIRSRAAGYFAAAALGGIIVGAVSLAYAASGGGVIHACASKKTGILRLSARCSQRRERPVSWNVQGPQGGPGPQGLPGMQGPQGTTGPQGPGGSTFTLTLNEGSTAGTVLATASGVALTARCASPARVLIGISGPTPSDYVHFVGGTLEYNGYGGTGNIQFGDILTHGINLNDTANVLWDGLVRVEGNASKYSRIDVSGSVSAGGPCTFEGMIIPAS
jgi:hypothetical protein